MDYQPSWSSLMFLSVLHELYPIFDLLDSMESQFYLYNIACHQQWVIHDDIGDMAVALFLVHNYFQGNPIWPILWPYWSRYNCLIPIWLNPMSTPQCDLILKLYLFQMGSSSSVNVAVTNATVFLGLDIVSGVTFNLPRDQTPSNFHLLVKSKTWQDEDYLYPMFFHLTKGWVVYDP